MLHDSSMIFLWLRKVYLDQMLHWFSVIFLLIQESIYQPNVTMNDCDTHPIQESPSRQMLHELSVIFLWYRKAYNEQMLHELSVIFLLNRIVYLNQVLHDSSVILIWLSKPISTKCYMNCLWYSSDTATSMSTKWYMNCLWYSSDTDQMLHELSMLLLWYRKANTTKLYMNCEIIFNQM